MKVEIELPEGISVSQSLAVVTVKGKYGEVKRDFSSPYATVKADGKRIAVVAAKDKKRFKAQVETFRAHIQNMIVGAGHGFRYEMEIVQSHFPPKVAVQGNAVTLENFIGEKHPRKVTIAKGVKAQVKGKTVIVEGADLEAVANTAARIEQMSRIPGKDHRTFQDGIYIIKKKELIS